MANKSGNKEFRTYKMQIEHSGLTFSSFFFVRTIMYFGFSHMFIMASFDRQKLFSILLFIEGLYAKVSI